MKYFIKHHQHKAQGLHEALYQAGHRPVTNKPDVLLIDHDVGDTSQNMSRKIIDMYSDLGSVVIIYPHTASLPYWYDGIYTPDKRVRLVFVIGEGHRKFMQLVRPEIDTQIIGWYLCPQLNFRPKSEIRKILFAPVHPPSHNLRPEAKEANARAFEKVCKLARSSKYQIAVRHIGSLEKQGLWYDSKVIYKAGKPDGNYIDIDNAHLVIAEGTFLHLAVARGKPAIGINQHNPPRGNLPRSKFPERWKEYENWVRYPLDMDDGNVLELIDRASTEEQKSWRDSFIGNDFNPKDFANTVFETWRKYAG